MISAADRNRLARWAHWLAIGIALWMVLIAGTALAAALEVRAIALTVSDLDAAVAFYEQALGFRKVGERNVVDREYDYLTGIFGTRVRTATLAIGDETVELDQYLAPAGRSIPVDSRSNDLWFQHFAIVVADMDKAYAHLMRFEAKSISSAPQTIPEWNKPAAGIRAYKFRDPDGHPLELLWFPKGKGNPKWQSSGGRLFLGIDHTAITVADTDKSAQFWNLLGLTVLGGSLNSGETQEQLDNAFGAVVRVTGLRPNGARGPGVEFLQYLTPGGGRAAPMDTRPSDLVHARIVLEVADLDALTEQLAHSKARFVSPRPVKVNGSPWGRELMVSDPDGHAVLLVQP